MRGRTRCPSQALPVAIAVRFPGQLELASNLANHVRAEEIEPDGCYGAVILDDPDDIADSGAVVLVGPADEDRSAPIRLFLGARQAPGISRQPPGGDRMRYRRKERVIERARVGLLHLGGTVFGGDADDFRRRGVQKKRDETVEVVSVERVAEGVDHRRGYGRWRSVRIGQLAASSMQRGLDRAGGRGQDSG